MIELSIIKLILKRNNYIKYNNIIYDIKLEDNKEIENILYIINKYYEEYKHHEYISTDELKYYFFSEYPSQKNNKIYLDIFDKINGLEISDSLATDIVHQYLEKNYAMNICQKLIPVINGDGAGKGLIFDIKELVDEFKLKSNNIENEKELFIDPSLDNIFEVIDRDKGLKWGLDCLNNNIGPLTGETLGHIFARVDVGKTSFLVSQIANFLPQLKEKEEILWLCTEESGKRVISRVYQNLLNLSSTEIEWNFKNGQKEVMQEKFYEMGGNKIKFYHKADMTMEDIKSYVETMEKPRLLVIDIADHITFRGDRDYSGPYRLGELYRRFRHISSYYHFDTITVGQASAECDGHKGLHLDHMHSSKTDKPGALDYAIGLGKTYDPAESELRWISIVKNKIGTTIKEINQVRFDVVKGHFYNI